MESCVLCLEINNDILDCIKANSTHWQDLQIVKMIEKHFWSLDTILPSSWICLSCWREIDCFHKFYKRIEEAHVNFGKIKVEDLPESVVCKEEILIDQARQRDLTEPEILIDQPASDVLENYKELTSTEPLDELDLEDMSIDQECKGMITKSFFANKDPLEKCKKSKKKKICKTRVDEDDKSREEIKIDDSKIKKEPMDLNYSDAVSDDNDISDVNSRSDRYSSETSEIKRRKAYSKHRTNRKENDKFIAEHFKHMFCDLCQIPFDDFPAIQKHFTEMHNQRGYVVCCKRKFFDRTRLVDHLHCHLNPDHFKCNECGKAMSDRISFDSHMLRVHRANEVVKQHSCDLCGKSFTEAYVLRIHKLTHLPEEDKKFPCGDCGKNYGSPYVLNQHRQAVHLKRFVKICYICGKTINSSGEFKIHMNKHEGIPLPVINCDVCGLRLTSERGLKLHKESQHPVGGKQEHPCPICPKVSPTLKALKKHINTMHEKGYDHKCNICEKAFKRSEALREHMATHTGTTLYTCPWCPKTFNSNGNMHAHRKKIHPKEWEESKLQKYSSNIPEI